MPCLDLQRPTLPPRLFHLHLSKMNGRSVLDRAPGVTGLPRCPWTRSSGGTSTFRRGDALRDRLRSAAGTRASRCVTSFETHWDAAVDMAMGDGGPAPLFLTVLRAPLAWAVSKVRHKTRRHVEACARAGAFEAPTPRCGDIDFRRFGLLHLGPLAPADRVAGCDGAAAPRAWTARQRIDVAVARLEASVFGVQEHMEATYCLWKYQFGAAAHGTKFRRECDCRGAARRGAARDEELRIAAAKHQENATLESFLRAERGLAEYARLYARADELFRDRCDAVEAATSVKLLCDDSYVVSPAPTAPTAAPTARPAPARKAVAVASDGARAPRRAAAGTSLVGLATMAAELAILAGLVAASL
ncbi:hypothetical protein AURANDRAFT_63883 [Aureococcus anophagefferens]|uniref:Uncharacterized protein n=1 Tax=Aureococcus anophagefferens TaxID=44056 RepID=F0Y851_AURAN|nr:hypothetical protein AURANDRAFT_63883 [Aureococcus anophagefferens]EGB08774.1 hypothetical protein AURANDRAFT_63883 [Aureococcus anophagefferens]|eukprot:XP_009036758.1 hypothetical protein AURANDRAFT_63883 [Aureococcus anophagefferens]